MGAEENKALVRRGTEEAWNKGNLAIVDELFADSYVSHGASSSQEVHGPQGAKQFVNQYRVAFPDTRITIEEQIAEGDLVASRWTGRGTHRGELMGIPPTGKAVTVSGTLTSRIVGGKVVEEWNHWDTMSMLQQLGVVSMPGQAMASPIQSVIRRYTGVDPAAIGEISRRAELDFLPRLSAVPGFVSYTLAVSDRHDLLTVSLFEEQAGTEESVRLAAEFIRQNLAALLPNPPELIRGRAAIREVVDNRQATAGVMRRYRADQANIEEAVRRVQMGLVPLIRAGRGFVSYIVVDTGQGEVISLSAFTDRAAAEESTRMAADWVRGNLATLLPTPPEVTMAEIKLRKVRATVAASAR